MPGFTGTVSARNGTTVWKEKEIHIFKSRGRVVQGGKIELLDVNVAKRKASGFEVVKVRIASGLRGRPPWSFSSIGWIQLSKCSFAHLYDPVAGVIDLAKSGSPPPPGIASGQTIGPASFYGTTTKGVYLGVIPNGTPVELIDRAAPKGKFGHLQARVRVLSDVGNLANGQTGWVSLHDVDFLKFYDPATKILDITPIEEPEPIVTGVVTKNISSLFGSIRGYCPDFRPGTYIAGDRLSLLSVIPRDGQFNSTMIQVKVLSSANVTAKSDIIGWIPLVDTDFTDLYHPETGFLERRRDVSEVNAVGIGMITNQYAPIYGGKLGYSDKLYLGGLTEGEQIELLSTKAIRNASNQKLAKIRVLSDQPGRAPSGSIAWVHSKNTDLEHLLDDPPEIEYTPNNVDHAEPLTQGYPRPDHPRRPRHR